MMKRQPLRDKSRSSQSPRCSSNSTLPAKFSSNLGSLRN
ncbi:Uncharacterised protein [Vibrio cholerae]|nr:Uncharacterised protein [Vibrio cholerae]